MATTKTTVASASYITTNASTTVTYTPAVEADVVSGVLVPNAHIINPGVFTAGTPREGTTSNPSNDVNA